MKRILLLFILCSIPLLSQDFFKARSDHFQVSSTLNSEDAAEQAYRMERLFSYIQNHLNLPEINGKFEMVRFGDIQEYGTWQEEQFGFSREGFQLYSKNSFIPQKLAVYGDLYDSEASTQITHLFVQQLLDRTNRDTPPWLRWGLASYYEKLRINREGQLKEEHSVYEDWVADEGPDYPWHSPSELISLSQKELMEEAQWKGELWLFTVFLMDHAQSDQSRILWESISLIPQGSQEDWPGQELITPSLIQGYNDFRDSFFYNPLAELQTLYETEEYTQALQWISEQEEDFSGRLAYFGGLINYHLGKWEEATEDFEKALDQGAPEMETRLSLAFCYWQRDMIAKVQEELLRVKSEREDLIPEELMHLVN